MEKGKEYSKKERNRLRRKEGKAKSILLSHEGITVSDLPTTTLYISNAGLGNGLSREHVYEWLASYTNLRNILMVERKPYCFVETQDVSSAEKIRELSGTKVKHDGIDLAIEHHIHFIEFIPSIALPVTKAPPGLLLLENYVNEADEKKLLQLVDWSSNEIQSQPSATGGSMKHRSVRHFGYEFKYSNNNVDPDCPLDEPIPAECFDIIDRLINDGHLPYKPDQLTVNKYEPGQGIPPHVDTHSAFLDPIISISLGSTVAMNFSHPDGECCPVVLPRRSVLVMSKESRYLWAHGIAPRKTDVIPSGQGLTLSYRTTRVSFTFRRLRRSVCSCQYPTQCDSQKFATSETDKNQPDVMELDEDMAKKLESMHVHQVYDQIASHFSGTRHTQWPRVAEFISRQPSGSILADIGCGNGKYLTSTPNSMFKIGFERSRGLVDVCESRGFPVVQADCLATPLLDSTVDTCICIAVVHHLSTESRRVKAINELIRILRPGGNCLIYVWAMEQKKNSVKSNYLKSQDGDSVSTVHMETLDGSCQLPVHKNRTQFYSSDMLVPWNLKSPTNSNKSHEMSKRNQNLATEAGGAVCDRPRDNMDSLNDKNSTTTSTSTSSSNSSSTTTSSNSNLFHRYYHIFKEGELEELCRAIPNCQITNSYYDQGNWCVELKKV